jgi:photosystem II stability/assembly factor-like uncharacterized protein
MTSTSTGVAGGGCPAGPPLPCGSDLLRTSDGGRHWHPTGLIAGPVSAAGNTVIIAGGWNGEQAAGVRVSDDAGAHWQETVAPQDIRFRQITRLGDRLVAVTTAGGLTSKDGGRTWMPYPLPQYTETGDLNLGVGPNYLLTSGPGSLQRSTDGGATWTSTPLPKDTKDAYAQGFGVDADHASAAVALVNDEATDDLHVLVSADAGRHWKANGTLALTGNDGLPAMDGAIVAFPDQAVEVSVDGGAHWSESDLGLGMDSTSVVQGTVWASGTLGVQPDTLGTPGAIVAVSTDGGRTWNGHELYGLPLDGASKATDIVALSATEAILTVDDSSLWRTTDAGATWHQEHPVLVTQS